MVFFVMARILFLLYHFKLSAELSVTDLALVLLYGLKMDISVTSYLLLLPGLILVLTTYLNNTFIYHFMKYYMMILLSIFIFLVLADVELYRHWGFRLDDTPLLYLANPKEVFGSAEPWLIVGLLIIWFCLVFLCFRLFKARVLPSIKQIKKGNWKISLYFMLITVFLVLPMRGSLGQSNMNVGFVYFHKSNTYANHAAINGIWNVQYYLLKSGKSRYDNNFFDKEKTENYFNDLYRDHGSTRKVLNTTRPNIILIALASR
jgi:hypothetical protein